ncbi:MAG: NAD(P)/FAD-dependent oxidoreductase [Phycisphaeraceae bacterium]
MGGADIDVVVIGAGVAGSTAAIGLAREGLGVALVDRAAFPRHKVCGCCLNADAVRMLECLGLNSALRRAGATPIDRIEIRSENKSVRVNSQGGLAVSRYTLDGLLHDAAAEAGCRVIDQTTARINRVPEPSEARVPVECSSPTLGQRRGVMNAKIVLVADGLAGSCVAGIEGARRTTKPNSLRGYGAQLPAGQHAVCRGEVAMHCGPGGYVGTVVLEDGSLDIAAAMTPAWVKAHRGPAGAVEAIAKHPSLRSTTLQDLAWRATAPLTGGRQTRWLPRVFFLGDSAGYVEPFTGEGMAWAMRSARALQPIAVRAAATWDDRHGTAWQHAYRRAVEQRQWRCKLFAQLLRRPRLLGSMIGLASLLPTSARQAAARPLLPPLFRPTPATASTPALGPEEFAAP